MVACSLVRSHRVLGQCLGGDMLMGWEDKAAGMGFYKSGGTGLDRVDVQ